MNTSTLMPSAPSREFICELVDNQCALNISEKPRIVIAAYCAVFLPWGFLALFDMINERWKSIRRVLVQGTFQLLIAFPTIAYTVYYIELQKADRDYKEMCAAIVAVCLSAFHFLRTAWGLWQAYWYWVWIKFCLVHLNQHGYTLDSIEKEFESFTPLPVRKNLSYNMRLNRLAWSMYVNSSVIDNEFFECDVPFRFNWPRLRHPAKWLSSEEPWFTPRHAGNSSIRYMIPFLAQFGKEWLEDCSRAKEIVEQKMEISSNGVLMTYATKHAQMLTTGGAFESDEEKMDANWSNTWSTILTHHEIRLSPPSEKGMAMPFGGKPDEFHGFSKYESKIKRLIENLPEELFEVTDYGDEKVKVLQGISAFHLESFMYFLLSEVIHVVGEQAVTEVPHEAVILPTTDKAEGDIQDILENDTYFGVSDQNIESSSTSLTRAPSENMMVDEEISDEEDEVHDRNECEQSRSEIGTRTNGTSEELPAVEDFALRAFERTFREKHLEVNSYQDILENSNYQQERRWPGSWSEVRVMEYTVHLENIFALSYMGLMDSWGFLIERKAFSPEDRQLYYSELCQDSDTVLARTVAAGRMLVSRCRSLWYYWSMCDLPNSVPPALGDIDHIGQSGGGRIKFIGYIMETVRDCLAKWTEHNITEDKDTSSWSPVVETESACIQFDSSDALSRQIRMLPNCQLEAHKYASVFRTFYERVVWECQKSILKLLDNDECAFGPSDVELMILCILGFPGLRVSLADRSGVSELPGFEVLPLICGSTWGVRIEFNTIDEKCVKVQMRIIPDRFSRITFVFEWARWIHNFEAWMKVLTCEYDEEDLSEVEKSLSESSFENSVGAIRANGDNVSGATHVSVEGGEKNDIGVSYSRNESMEDMADHDPTSNSFASAGSDLDVDVTLNNEEEEAEHQEDRIAAEENNGDDVRVDCTCDGKYRLNTKAKRVFVTDRFGTKKYFWEWEVWRPQRAFEKHRYPILHDLQTTMVTCRGLGKETDEQKFADECGSAVADDGLRGNDSFANADEHV